MAVTTTSQPLIPVHPKSTRPGPEHGVSGEDGTKSTTPIIVLTNTSTSTSSQAVRGDGLKAVSSFSANADTLVFLVVDDFAFYGVVGFFVVGGFGVFGRFFVFCGLLVHFSADGHYFVVEGFGGSF